ncbi:type II toxin-antitoxin system RelE/ParE family toxin [Spirosoma jeollabukense]
MNDQIWEFRTLYQGKAYRLFAFWDKVAPVETLVIATHGMLKKTNKTPPKEIEKAETIRKQYLNEKK